MLTALAITVKHITFTGTRQVHTQGYPAGDPADHDIVPRDSCVLWVVGAEGRVRVSGGPRQRDPGELRC